MVLVFSASARTASAEMKNPRLQLSLQKLEVARGFLDQAMHVSPPELRDPARDALGHVDAAIHEIHDELEFLHTPRQVEPGHAAATDRPIRASRETLAKAVDDLTRDLRDSDIRGRLRSAMEHMRAALEITERMSHREEVLLMPAAPPPPPPVVEMRHPRLQASLQHLEIARELLDQVEHRAPGEWHEEAHIAREDVNAAIHEVMESLAAAGAPRVIAVGHPAGFDHPIHAAKEELHRAVDDLGTVSGGEFHGFERRALERTRLALDEVDRLTSRE
jgi:hypothetical protein